MEDATSKKESPRQDLPNEGTALPSRGTNSEGGSASTDPPTDSMTTQRHRQSRSKGPVAEAQSAQARYQEVKELVQGLVEDRMVRTDESLIFLRKHPLVMELGLKDHEIEALILQAKSLRDGRVSQVQRGDKLSMKPVPWLWEGMLMKGGCNLIYGDPKTGKTRLILGFLGAYVNEAGSFLGKKIGKDKNELLIIGPDMQQSTWGHFLHEFHLGDAEGYFNQQIRSIVTQGMSFRLNDEGINLILEHCKESRGLVILIDSLTTVMSGLGLDENKPSYVDPLEALMDAVAPYEATLIVIHHAKKETSNGSLSTVARGSSALSAKVDTLVRIKQFRATQFSEPTGEIELTTGGRVGKAVSLLAKWDEGASCWVSAGTRTEQLERIANEKVGNKLTEWQDKVVRCLITSFSVDKKPMTAREITTAIGLNPKTHQTRVYGYLKPLIEKKRYVLEAGEVKSGPDKGKALFKPSQSALDWAVYKGNPDTP